MPQPSSDSVPAAPRPRRAARWWLAGGTFVVGLLVGVVIAGLLIRSSPAADSAGSAPVSGGTGTPGSASSAEATPSVGATVEIVVNDECLRAINEAQDAYNTIDRIGAAIGDFDLSALDGIIRELQPLQAALRADVSACKVKTRLPDGSLVQSELASTTSVDSPPTVIVDPSSDDRTTGNDPSTGIAPTTSAPVTTG